ncbi:putative cytochrome P450 6a14 [Pseudolycoriella hygida]|uniref:Cytochrome P450 6a14 n=1 Tax=Pseudolycoriella hygida TaxID=35572 RepID=A0A9Q0MR59_9DIPT|nr:putative cytochrome P450 6a14 [Pseudolycoriella hygida]
MVFWIVGALLVAVIYLANQYFFSYWKRLGIPQDDPPFLVGSIGTALLGRQSVGETFSDFYNKFKHNKIQGLYFSYRPALVVNDPEVIQEVMIKDFTSFHDRGLFIDEKVDPLGAHLFMLGGQKWRDLRVKLSPTFTSGKLKVMYPIIRDCAKTLQEYVKKNCQGSKTYEFDARDLFARFTTNVISSVAFGIENDCINDRDNIFRKMGLKIFEVNLKVKILGILAFFVPKVIEKFKVRQIDEEINDFIFSVVKQTLDLREKGGKAGERKDFMQLMIQLKNQGYVSVDKNEENEVESQKSSEPKKLNFEEIAAQAFVFFVAGFETSSSTMNFCMYELSKNADAQRKVHEELDSLLQSGDVNDLTYDVLAQMKYLDWCIDETLRKYPIVPILNRESTKSHTFSGTNMTIEKGTPINIPVLGLQRDPEIYDNPLEFRPERFQNSSNGNGNSKGLFYMPFGDGPRNCIGARMGKLQTKIGLVSLLTKFKYEIVDKTLLHNEIEFDSTQFILTPKAPVMLKASAR